MKRTWAFTLLELLVVMAVIGVVMSLLVPALGAARRGAMRAVCASNLRQMGLASNMYLDDNNREYWSYFSDVAGGRLWWFGFEAGGPNVGMTNRPLDKSRGVLGSYMTSLSEKMQCPSFPYHEQTFFHKFDQNSASYGFNMHLNSRKSEVYAGRESEVFVFADAIHFDKPFLFNEGHYIIHTPNVLMMSGYAHFRHDGQAQAVMMDGHVWAQALQGAAHQIQGGGPAGNLVAINGSDAIYGK